MDSDEQVAEAWRSGTPLPRLRELAGRDARLARIVASRIDLPSEFAEELAERAAGLGAPWLGVQRALAAQPATPAARLALLAAHPDASVRRVVAVHRETPEKSLTVLADDESATVRRSLAARERLPYEVATRLLADESGEVRLTMVRRVDARPEELRALAIDPDVRVRRVVAALGYADGADLTDPDAGVRRNAVRRRSFAELAPRLASLVRDEDLGVRELVAVRYRNQDPVALAVLATDAESSVRRGAAGNPFTPVGHLIALADDADLEVLCALGRNEFAPAQALAGLVDTITDRYADAARQEGYALDQVGNLVHDVLGHPATPPESLRRLHALGPSHFHEGNAMSQPNWPADLLIDFGLSYCASTVDTDEERASFAAVGAARHTAPLQEVLASMVRSPIYYLRGAVANRHVPPEALAEYARGADPEVDGYHLDDLAANPALPLEIQLAWATSGSRCRGLLKNPELPDAVLAVITEDEHWADEARLIVTVRAHRAAGETPC
ncbi:hypothetical protein ABZ490_44710 [Streptomyces sp. NPDC005811]|uniref:hypothetical protein n=1 Tax=Streptomyces sp. NPDC005811 TaxID=3154565 RepID=UPI0033F8E925